MNEQLKQALELISTNKDLPEVQGELLKFVPITSAIKLVEEHEDGKKFLNQTADKRVSQGITTAIDNFKKEKLPSMISEEVAKAEEALTKKLKPELTESEKKLIEIQKKQEGLELREKQKDTEVAVLKYLSEQKLPVSFATFFKGTSFEELKPAVDSFKDLYNTTTTAYVEAFIKEQGYVPAKDKTGGNPGDTITEDKLKALEKRARELGTVQARTDYALAKREHEAQKK
jgi:hypothetical protein